MKNGKGLSKKQLALGAVIAGAVIGTAAYAMMKKKDKVALKRKVNRTVKGARSNAGRAVDNAVREARNVADSEIRPRVRDAIDKSRRSASRTIRERK